MIARYISCPEASIMQAVAAVMSCVPKPWTERMVEEAVTAVLDIADQWRMGDTTEVSLDDILDAFLESGGGADVKPFQAEDPVGH